MLSHIPFSLFLASSLLSRFWWIFVFDGFKCIFWSSCFVPGGWTIKGPYSSDIFLLMLSISSQNFCFFIKLYLTLDKIKLFKLHFMYSQVISHEFFTNLSPVDFTQVTPNNLTTFVAFSNVLVSFIYCKVFVYFAHFPLQYLQPFFHLYFL